MLKPKVAMIMFKAPPISSMMSASSAGKPPAAWRSSIATSRLSRRFEPPRVLTSLVAATTTLLMEAMLDLKVFSAVLFCAAVEAELRDSAVELMTAVYFVTVVKRVSILARAAGSSAGDNARSTRALSEAGAAMAREAKELTMAKQVKKDFIWKVGWKV